LARTSSPFWSVQAFTARAWKIVTQAAAVTFKLFQLFISTRAFTSFKIPQVAAMNRPKSGSPHSQIKAPGNTTNPYAAAHYGYENGL
jgi:hypothetical protein